MSRYRIRRLGAKAKVAILLICGMLAVSGTAFADTVRIGGTGAALGTVKLLAEALSKVDPQFSLEVVPNLGSNGGLKALARDAIQLAVISRPIKPEEAAQGLVAIEYGKTPFVLATATPGIGGLDLGQIAEIYAGKRTVWPDGTPIRLVLRPANDGDTDYLAAFSPAVKEGLARAMAREGMVTGVTDQESANEIERLKGGFGSSSLALIKSEKRHLVALPIGGVAPSVANLANGTYPYTKPMYMVTKGTMPAAVAKFIAFVRSAEGRRILVDNGHWVTDTPDSRVAKAR